MKVDLYHCYELPNTIKMVFVPAGNPSYEQLSGIRNLILTQPSLDIVDGTPLFVADAGDVIQQLSKNGYAVCVAKVVTTYGA